MLLLVFSLPFMKFRMAVGSFHATATDLLFVVAASALAVAVVRREVSLRWNPLYPILLFYLGAMLASLFAAEDPDRAWLKLATQVYLLSLPLLVASLIDSIDDLRAVLLAWLAATAVTATLGAVTILPFSLGVEQPLWGYALHEYGTLPPGPYPRVESTFDFPAMLCNYLTVSLLILLVARHRQWVGGATFWLVITALGLTALFTLTPGLGGVFLALGIWGYRFLQRPVAGLALATGTAVALAFLLAAAITPIIHPTAPFLIDLPGVDWDVAPSVRMMTWVDSAQRFFEHPLVGAGIGADAANVRYVDPSGNTHLLSDAHNAFLNFAAQCGLFGLAAMVLLVVDVARRAGPLRGQRNQLIRFALAVAWLIAFVYEGLTGSYEDARHLWVLLGLLVAAARLEQESDGAGEPARSSPAATASP